VYIRYVCREITKYTVIYGVYIRFWPTLHIELNHMLAACLLSTTSFLHTHTHTCTHTCTYIHTSPYVHAHTHTRTHVHVYTSTYMHAHTHVHVHTQAHTCMHTHVHVHKHTRTHTIARTHSYVPQGRRGVLRQRRLHDGGHVGGQVRGTHQ